MSLPSIAARIAAELSISTQQVNATIQLFNEGCTTPFIARYRKEVTQSLDEVQIERIRSRSAYYEDMVKRKEFIIDTIREQGKLTADLERQLNDCWDALVLEDLYLPYKPKRKTRATIAREKGLEPLAHWILNEQQGWAESEADKFLSDAVTTINEALEGARDIVAEDLSERAEVRAYVRNLFERHATVTTKVVRAKEGEAAKYRDYFDYQESLHRMPSHRLLAVLRAEEEGLLRVYVEPDQDRSIEQLQYHVVKRRNDSSRELREAVSEAYKRLLSPTIEHETRKAAKEKADAEAIRVFAENVRQLFLAAPLGGKRIMAIDPGFRTGCKVVCLNQEGDLVYDTVIYPHEPQRKQDEAERMIIRLVNEYSIEAFAIGNGTAGRETEEFVRSIRFSKAPDIFLVNESGASIYSASEAAREEFPDKDITVRGAASIGRRLADPLAELVKIDPKSIGVGQYQHDVNQRALKESLDAVVVQCVNQVGVNVNTASRHLLAYVSGLNETTAKNIVEYRAKHGAFSQREQLKEVPRLGEKTFEQCAAFLRIPGAKHVLDNSAVHPERYKVVEKMAKKVGCTVNELVTTEAMRKKIVPSDYITSDCGLPTIQDILKELEKPGRDPRAQLEAFEFASVKTMDDLHIGMVLPGVVTNITRFGCFVDIGVKQDGMVHISELANKYVADPADIVALQQHVQVKVLDVDTARKRIALSMKQVGN
jgi:protein Tex